MVGTLLRIVALFRCLFPESGHPIVVTRMVTTLRTVGLHRGFTGRLPSGYPIFLFYSSGSRSNSAHGVLSTVHTLRILRLVGASPSYINLKLEPRASSPRYCCRCTTALLLLPGSEGGRCTQEYTGWYIPGRLYTHHTQGVHIYQGVPTHHASLSLR